MPGGTPLQPAVPGGMQYIQPLYLCIFSAGWHSVTNCNTRWYAALWTLTPLYISSARWYAVINCSTRWYAVLPIWTSHIISSARWHFYANLCARWYAVFPIPIAPSIDSKLIILIPHLLQLLQCQGTHLCLLQYTRWYKILPVTGGKDLVQPLPGPPSEHQRR